MPHSRLMCLDCFRPQQTCLCDLRVELDNQVTLTVLQHPSEQKHPKGTVPLLNMSLSACHLIVGETVHKEDVLLPNKTHWLLYPPSPNSPTLAAEVLALQLPSPADIQLVVLDGTWRKSRKLLHLNPWLQVLPRLSVSPGTDRRYRIRHTADNQHLSTLEASCLALGALEQRLAYYQPLLGSLEKFMSRFEAFLPDSNINDE